MRLASYNFCALPSFGIEQEDSLIDIPALFAEQGRWNAPTSVLDVIRRGASGLREIRDALDVGTHSQKVVREHEQVELLPAVVQPPKIFCIGRNYAEHAKEAGFEMSPHPIMFNRYASTLIGSGAHILFPKVSEQLDWEGELAVVIGKSHRGQISVDDAMDYVFGYTAFNDITVRNFQFRTTQYLAGKNFRTSGPLGPVVVTRDELKDPHALRIITRVNGQTMQDGNTADMHFNIPYIINHLSEFLDLEAGDVIAMGTPAGVGFKRKPPVFLKVGDVVEVELSGVGVLTNTVVADA